MEKVDLTKIPKVTWSNVFHFFSRLLNKMLGYRPNIYNGFSNIFKLNWISSKDKFCPLRSGNTFKKAFYVFF